MGVGTRAPPQRGCECPKKYISRIICTVMVWWRFGFVRGVLGGLGCFDGPHEGYANRSNSQTSLPRAIGRPTGSGTVLLRTVS